MQARSHSLLSGMNDRVARVVGEPCRCYRWPLYMRRGLRLGDAIGRRATMRTEGAVNSIVRLQSYSLQAPSDVNRSNCDKGGTYAHYNTMVTLPYWLPLLTFSSLELLSSNFRFLGGSLLTFSSLYEVSIARQTVV